MQHTFFEKSLAFPHGTTWVQDLFVTAKTIDNKSILLVPETYKWFFSLKEKPKINDLLSDNTFIENLSKFNLEIKRLKLTFSGGKSLLII